MRLLIISTEFPPGPGGIGTHAFHLASNMERLGWQVRVLTLQDYASDHEIRAFNRQLPFLVQTLHHQRSPFQELLHRQEHLKRHLREWRPDMLIASGEQSVLLAAVTRSDTHRTAIWHGVIPPAFWNKRLNRWAYERADQIVAVSQYSCSKMRAMGIRPRRCVVINNGADAQQFKPVEDEKVAKFRHELGLPDQPLILTVGNVSERKGQDIVIRALPRILAEYPNVHYLIAGLPTRKDYLMHLAQDLGVAGNVHFLGKVSQEKLPILYCASNLFVLTSRHSSDGEFEGYGIVVVEAALCQKPSVVTSNSGLMEAVQDGETGFVVPENDPEETARALCTLLADPELTARMGRTARQRALREQTWEHSMQRYDLVLRELAKREDTGTIP